MYSKYTLEVFIYGQQPNMVPSPVGQHSPVNPSFSHTLFSLQDALVAVVDVVVVEDDEDEDAVEAGTEEGAVSVVVVAVDDFVEGVGTGLLDPYSVG
mmetsp:Transcript_44696/g.107824  ORF Transcript_44696/g.107824 Transcript_44696/m.107824 type:complete len:97 (-) Transcript_44696:348-638(-)